MSRQRRRQREQEPIQPRRKTRAMVEDIEESIKNPARKEISTETLIPSGSTMLNLACSDNPFAAYGLGKIITMPGSSSSGKTILMLTAMAEMAIDSRFDDYQFYYDDGEESLAFDMDYLFKCLVGRLTPPGGYDNDEEPIYSNTIQDFKANILSKCQEKKSFIYVLDSLDALTTDEELEKEYKKAILMAKGDIAAIKALTGSYNTEKAKILGQALRMINGAIKKTNSALFIVQQIRQKIGVVFGKKTTTSGGNAPFFYSSHQAWLDKLGQIKDPKYGLKIGNKVKAGITKNKITGKLRDVEFDVYYDYGIDDVGSMVDYLCTSKTWKKGGARITPIGFSDIESGGETFYKKDLVKIIEKENAENDIKKLCGETWNHIEEAVKLSDRKRKY